MHEEVLICPVCKKIFKREESRIFCENGHSFDRAREGYYYLVSKQGYSRSGDSVESIRSRREFLSAGYYEILAKAVADIVEEYSNQGDLLTDACCGEGYYSGYIYEKLSGKLRITGFDLSKAAIKLAAKSYPNSLFYVSNISSIPQLSGSADIILHSFAPVHNSEFSRILKNNGFLIDIIPAKRHLWQLKEILYETPYENDEKSVVDDPFDLTESRLVSDTIKLDKNSIKNVLFMTPYAYKTSEKSEKKLLSLDFLETKIEFKINVYKNLKCAF